MLPLVPSCCSLIHPGPSDKHLDHFGLLLSHAIVVMETSLKDLCSLCDIHAAHALTD